MIDFSRSTSSFSPVIRILGVGGAGCDVLDRLILDGIDGAAVVALNTDVQALNASVAPDKVHLGRETTRGLGAGGDPEVGYSAAEEAIDSIQSAVAGAHMIFVCVGLGGGTGSGAAPLIAHFARKSGATVITFATMPFSFEGKRRRAQAEHALAQISEQSDLVVCFDNDRMGEASAPTAGVQQAFVAADAMLSSSIRSIANMVRGRGLVGVGLDELASALRQRDSRCLFGYGESDGANRAHEALERALKSPLMDKGRMLSEAHTVLVHISGGTDLTLNEVTVLMDEFHRYVSDSTHIQFGLVSDAKLGRKLAVTILSSTSAKVEIASTRVEAAPAAHPVAAPQPPAPRSRQSAPASPPAAAAASEKETLFALEPIAPAPEGEAEPPPAPKIKSSAPKTDAAAAKAAAKAAAEIAAKKEPKAEQMPLEAPSRGRFDKGEPTIVDGQDLDVPTFMRRNVKLK
jgi:cell division protein FtsZ